MANNVVLHYFNGRGKAEGIRLMLAAADVQFKEELFTEPEQFEKLKNSGDLLFQQVPLLEMDGQKIVQSGAILRYLARKYDLYGKNDVEKLNIDMLTEGTRDFLGFFMQLSFGDDSKILDDIRQKAVPRYMPIFEKVLNQSKSGFLVGDRLSMADVCLFEVLRHIPERAPDAYSGHTKLKEFYERMKHNPNIAAYLNGPQCKGPNDSRYTAEVRKVLKW